MIAPPFGMASRALTIKFMTTCCSWAASMKKIGHSSAGSSGGGMTDGRASRRSIASIAPIVSANRQTARQSRLFAAEGQQLSRDARGAVDRLERLAQQRDRRRSGRQLAAGDVDAGGNHREQVVEVVRDAGRHAPDRLQLLRLLQPGPQRRRARVRLLHGVTSRPSG